MQEVIIDQIPAPTLIVGAQQGHVTVTLVRGLFGGDADHGHGAQRSFPDNLPTVSAAFEPDFTPGAVGALRNRVPVHGEAVGFDKHVAGTIVRVPRVVKGSQFGLQRSH